MSHFPPDYKQEFMRRAKIARALSSDKELASTMMRFYKDNPVAWINDWCVTFDPRKKELKLMPFVMFDRQVDLVNFIVGCLKDKEGGLVEKARDMGASWICVAISVWLWIFHEGSVVGWGSRKEEYVDKKGDPKAIFPKIRQILENLPLWMLPKDYNPRLHNVFMRLINPNNGSAITGEAGDNIGRGGRTTIYFKDESAHYERPESIEAALGDNTDVQIDISSVNGSANVFYRRRMAGTEWAPNCSIPKGQTRIFIMDWRDHPNKDQEWYDLRRNRAAREGLLHIFAQEVDRDYAGSVDRVIIPPEWIKASVDAHIKLGFGDDGIRAGAQDVADEGRDKHALVTRHGVILQTAEAWGDGDAGDAAKKAVLDCVMAGVHELYYDCIGVGVGFKVGINNMKEAGSFPLNLSVHPWDAGGAVLNPEDYIIPNDDQSPTNINHYENVKAQAWWDLRIRFYKTFKAVTEGEKYHPDELISLKSDMPNLHQLTMELSQARHKYSKNGKVMVDKKPDGSVSPNLADAAVMCYFPIREISILDVL